MSEVESKAKKQPSRDGKMQVAGYMPKDSVFALQELLLRLSRDRGERVTMQEAIAEALSDFGRKHGVKILPE